ncbi:MAG: Holliday junction branch migration protein RuvA [Rikenellaceae bacterium]
MYEYIKGKIADLSPAHAVIEAGGVGYFLNISLQSYSKLEGADEALLYTHFIVREDLQQLYGFATTIERELFRMLLSVSGVGGGTARMILSKFTPEELRAIIQSENAATLKGVKGLGLKTAQKIIVDLSGKTLALGIEDGGTMDKIMLGAELSARSVAAEEALAALVMLGFAKIPSQRVVDKLLKERADMGVEELIRVALSKL